MNIENHLVDNVKSTFLTLKSNGVNSGYLIVYTDYTDNSSEWIIVDNVEKPSELISHILYMLDGMCDCAIDYVLDMSKDNFEDAQLKIKDCINDCLLYIQRGVITE